MVKAIALAIANFIFSFIYLTITVIAVIRFKNVYRKEYPFYKNSWVFILCLVLLSASTLYPSAFIYRIIVRIAWLMMTGVNALWIHDCIPVGVGFLLSSLPGVFMYCIFLGLVIYWAELYVGNFHFRVDDSSPLLFKTPRPIERTASFRWTISVIMFLLVGIILSLFVWDIFQQGNTCDSNLAQPMVRMERIIYVAIACVYVSSVPVTLGFWIYSFRTFERLHAEKVSHGRSASTRRLLVKVAILVILCLSCFVVRALSLVTIAFNIWQETFVFELLYYGVLEIFPLVFIMAWVLTSTGQSVPSISSFDRINRA